MTEKIPPLTIEEKIQSYNKISNALGYLLTGNRFYYYIVSNLKIQSTQDIPTIAVGFFEGGSKKISIRYNPRFINGFEYQTSIDGPFKKFEFSDQEMSDLLVHELLHICLRHLFNVEMYSDKKVLNWAQDVVVNDMIFRNRNDYNALGQEPQPKKAGSEEERLSLVNFAMTKHRFESTKNLNVEEHTFGDIYRMIEQEVQNNPGLMAKLGKEQAQGRLISDGHNEFQPGEGESQSEAEQANAPQADEIEAMLKSLLTKAMKENFDRGRLPSELLQVLGALEPKKDYRDTLNHFVKNCKVDVMQNTWKKPSKRYGFIARGKTSDFKPKILLGVDSSGSVFGHPAALEKIAEYFQFAVGFCDKIQLIYCDTQVRLDKEFVAGDTIPPIQGGGGTVLQPIFDRALEDEYDGVVLISDGYVDSINTHGLPHVALIVPGGQLAPGIEESNTIFFTEE